MSILNRNMLYAPKAAILPNKSVVSAMATKRSLLSHF